jgi:Spy/CpxP family protein refolding chaperone
MSDQNIPAEPSMPAPNPRRARWGRTAILGATLVAGVAVGAGGLAAAVAGQGGWHGGPPLGRIQAMVERAFDSVGATSDQEARAHDLVAATFKDLEPLRGRREALRNEVLSLLKAPTIDRAAAEKLRAQHVAELDTASKRLVSALADLADILTPEQRSKLADNAREWHERGRHGGWHD